MLQSKKSETKTSGSRRAAGAIWRTFNPSRITTSVDHEGFPWHDVIGQMGIDRTRHGRPARLDVGKEPDERRNIVAFGEPFSAHQPTLFEDVSWMQEAVGGYQIDLGVLRPAREEFSQDPRGRALPHCNAPREADHVGHLGGRVAEKRGASSVKYLLGFDIEVEESGQWQVDIDDLLHGHALVEPLKTQQILGRQREGGVSAQPSPLSSGDLSVEGPCHHRVSACRPRWGYHFNAGLAKTLSHEANVTLPITQFGQNVSTNIARE